MLSNRYFKVNVGYLTSKPFTIKNGLSQGLVLAPALFNLYTSDMTETRSKKFSYADDITIPTQSKTFEKGEATLTMTLITSGNTTESGDSAQIQQKLKCMPSKKNNKMASKKFPFK